MSPAGVAQPRRSSAMNSRARARRLRAPTARRIAASRPRPATRRRRDARRPGSRPAGRSGGRQRRRERQRRPTAIPSSQETHVRPARFRTVGAGGSTKPASPPPGAAHAAAPRSSARARRRNSPGAMPPLASGCLSAASESTGEVSPPASRCAASRRKLPGGDWSSGTPALSSTSIPSDAARPRPAGRGCGRR